MRFGGECVEWYMRGVVIGLMDGNGQRLFADTQVSLLTEEEEATQSWSTMRHSIHDLV